MAETKTVHKGYSLFTLVFVVFLILKLTGTGPVANWDWVYVCLPIIIQASIAGAVCFCACGVFGCKALLTKSDEPQEQTIEAVI